VHDNTKFKPTERFTGLANVYAAARPSYPDAAIEFIMKRCNLAVGSIIADVGCGTGISSRLFGQRGVGVLGIEPNFEMRESARADRSPGSAQVAYMEGTGEETGLGDGEVDAVLAAQAFHWLEPEAALKEFHRILVKDGWVVLMWNERDEADEFTRAYGDVIRTAPDTHTVEMGRGTAGNALFHTPLLDRVERTTFTNEQVLDEQGLIMRACSNSYAPKEGESLAKFKKALKAAFAQFEVSEQVAIKYETSVYTGHRV
jgi:ubiquinone/menaquinone biosynthesis C-methylase UbiE